jgi:hypothetical protein
MRRLAICLALALTTSSAHAADPLAPRLRQCLIDEATNWYSGPFIDYKWATSIRNLLKRCDPKHDQWDEATETETATIMMFIPSP